MSIPLILQTYDYDCSRACALMVAPEVTPPRPTRKNGLKPEKFVEWAEKSGVLVHHGFNLALCPGMIVLVMHGVETHYIVFTHETSRYLHFHDPLYGKIKMTPLQFRRVWTGWGLICR